MMELYLVIAVIFLFIFLNNLTFIIPAILTPKDTVFLGTVHWPEDYFYYLSQFAQGQTNWFQGYDLYTTDFSGKTYIGMSSIFLGKLFSFIRLNQIYIYQLSVTIFAVLFLALSYLLIRKIFAHDQTKRLISFILFVSSNSLPIFSFNNGKINLWYYDYWYNNGIPFNRLGGVPHHLIARMLISLSLLLGICWWEKYLTRARWSHWLVLKFILLLLPASLFLSNIEPVHWGLVSFTLLLTPILTLVMKLYKKNEQSIGRSVVTLLMPGFFFLFIGLPMVLYLRKLFFYPPYSQLVKWEAGQQLQIDFIHFLKANGPVAILALLGIYLFMKKINISKILAVVFSLTTISLFFSPVGQTINIVNVRFLPATTTIFLACFASELIVHLGTWWRKKRYYLPYILLILTLLIYLPVYFPQLKQRLAVDKNSQLVYLPKAAYDTYIFAKKNSNEEDNFLVIKPYNLSFPAITSRRVFEGHSLLTTDFIRKKNEADDFFAGKYDDKRISLFLSTNNINYIVAYPLTFSTDNKKFLYQIYNNGFLAIYKVKV